MQCVMFMSLKGGCGKSTALMAVAGVLIEQGLRVAIFESDENQPIWAWRENAIRLGTWDSNCELFPAGGLDTFGASYAQAVENGFDYALVDSQGGGSELNITMQLNADLVIIPTALTTIDVDTALATLELALEIKKQNSVENIIALLATNIPLRMSKRQKEDLHVLTRLPLFEATLREREAFASLQRGGMLHKTLENYRQNPARRVFATHYDAAHQDAVNLASEIRATFEEV